LVRYTAKPDRADENEALSLAVFNELKITQPQHVAYALFRDGAVFVNTRDDDASALVELPTFKAYAKDVNERSESPPEPMRLNMNLLASYGL
jgi:hypothetical protein